MSELGSIGTNSKPSHYHPMNLISQPRFKHISSCKVLSVSFFMNSYTMPRNKVVKYFYFLLESALSNPCIISNLNRPHLKL